MMRRRQIELPTTCSCVFSRPRAEAEVSYPSLVRRNDLLVVGQDFVGRRQCDRRIEVCIDGDPLKHALVDLRHRDFHAIALVVGVPGIRQRGYTPRPIAIVATQPVSRIVDAAVLVLGRSNARECVGIGARSRLQGEAAPARFGQDPGERYMGERVIRISAADIGMHAGEPDLGDPLRIRIPDAGGRGFRALVPQQGMERGALVVERERVAGLANQGMKLPVRQFERPQIPADAPRHLVDG